MRTVTLVHHQVQDFDAWKQVYDTFREVQRGSGVRFHQVLRSTEDPNVVVVQHAFDSREEADRFFDMPELKDAMGRAGVDLSSLQVEHLDEVLVEDL